MKIFMASLKHQLSRFKTIIIILVIVVILLVIILVRRSNTPILDPSLNIETVQVRNVQNVVTAEGNLHANDERFVYLPSLSKVTSIKVSVNDKVSKDDVLAEVESTNQLGSTTTTEIKSPIKGTVVQIGYKENDIANASSVGFEIADLSSYKVIVYINETDIPNIKNKQSAKINFPAISLDDLYDAKITFVSPSPIDSSGVVNYEVDLSPSKLPSGIKLGMSVDVDITTAEVDNVLAIPETYLIEKDNKNYVKLLTWTNDQKTQYDISEVEITVGLKTNEYVEVKSGLKQGDEIVEPSYVAKSGLGIFGN